MATTALLWAVHHDFLRDMSRIEDGQVAAVDGAQQLPDTDAAAPTRARRASSEGLPKLSIVFGTESGNAELVAEELGAALSEHQGVTVRDIAALDPRDPASALELEVPHQMICSTYGDGELPVSARPFCQALRAHAPSLGACAMPCSGWAIRRTTPPTPAAARSWTRRCGLAGPSAWASSDGTMQPPPSRRTTRPAPGGRARSRS